MSSTHWLPELILYDETDWASYETRLFDVFDNCFLKSKPQYKGFDVNPRPGLIGGKNAGFWHLISTDDPNDARAPRYYDAEVARIIDLDRCERIAWIKPVIEADSADVMRWTEERTTSRGIENRLHIALPDFSYMVVLGPKPKPITIVTAFFVKEQYQRRAYRKKWENNPKK